jgi:predicted ATPase/class 3 adenylate cyclase
VPLPTKCSDCEFLNRAEAKFCGGCGKVLSASVEKNPQPDSQRWPAAISQTTQAHSHIHYQKESNAERRQLTVMFCDLIGSTALSTQLDQEDLLELMLTYQNCNTRAIESFEGIVARYMGDGVMAYFGYPQAHEDDAERAVRAGLEVVSAVAQLDAELGLKYGVQLSVRVGIATGPVVVGDLIGKGPAEEMPVVGETPNLAARLESVAAPNTVVISPGTLHLVRGLFETEDMGQFELKGFPQPIKVWRVNSAKTSQNRFEAIKGSELSSFVSRVEEIKILWDGWQSAVSGSGQIILLDGEPGVGKSRILHVLKDRIRDQRHISCEWRCSPFYQNSAFYPIIDFIQYMLEIYKDDTAQKKLEKLEAFLDRLEISLADNIPILAPLVSVPVDDRYPLPHLTPRLKKQKILEVLTAIPLSLARQNTLLLIVEDLHWVDPSTMDLLSMLIERAHAADMLIVLSFRPSFTPQWSTGPQLHRLSLDKLKPSEAEQLVNNVSTNKLISPQLRAQIVDRADGIPLFIEELTKYVLETTNAEGSVENSKGPTTLIPATLRDSLMARLDKLGAAKEIAQLGATLGREFTYYLINSIVQMGSTELQQNLSRLCEAGLLYQQGQVPDQIYIFKHALIQDTAYDSLLKSKRRAYHKHIAQVLEADSPELGVERPELLAHHFSRAGLLQPAIGYWHGAALQAVDRSANTEAIDHLNHGLSLLPGLPDTPERIQLEIKLQVALGAPLIGAKGYAAPEVEIAFARAQQLCQPLGEAPELFRVLSGLGSYYLIRANLEKARENQSQCLKIAQTRKQVALLLEGHSWLGTTLFYLNNLNDAKKHLHQAIDLYNLHEHRTHGFKYGLDPAVLSHVHIVWILWLQGHTELAQQEQKLVNEHVEILDHPLSTIHTLNFEIVHHYFRGETEIMQSKAEEQIRLASHHQFPHYVAYATIMRGSALAQQGQLAAGIEEMQRGIAARQETGAELALPLFLSQLADAYNKKGQTDRGLEILADAMSIVEKTGERWWQPELIRLHGELLLAQSVNSKDPDKKLHQAEQCFQKAVLLALSQNARSLEMRALSSLNELKAASE